MAGATAASHSAVSCASPVDLPSATELLGEIDTRPLFIPWKRKMKSKDEEGPKVDLKRKIISKMNKWNNMTIDLSIRSMRQLLVSDKDAVKYLMDGYLGSISQYYPQTTEQDPLTNPMVKVYVDHMCKILKPSDPNKGSVSKDNVFVSESLVDEAKDFIYKKLCNRILADFSAESFDHTTYYIMTAKHAAVNLISLERYTL